MTGYRIRYINLSGETDVEDIDSPVYMGYEGFRDSMRHFASLSPLTWVNDGTYRSGDMLICGQVMCDKHHWVHADESCICEYCREEETRGHDIEGPVDDWATKQVETMSPAERIDSIVQVWLALELDDVSCDMWGQIELGSALESAMSGMDILMAHVRLGIVQAGTTNYASGAPYQRPIAQL